MLKFNRVVCTLAVLACVAVVFARPIKILDLVPEPIENAGADGVATMNHENGSNQTLVRLTLIDFTPFTEYRAVFTIEYAGSSFTGANVTITTNAAGNGHGKSAAATDITFGGEACVYVDVYAGEELRATGTSCP